MTDHCSTWVEGAGWDETFDAAVQDRLSQDRRGREFSDSDVYTLTEAMAWEIGRTCDEHPGARPPAGGVRLTGAVAAAVRNW